MREWRRCPVRGHHTLLLSEPLTPRPAELPDGPCPFCPPDGAATPLVIAQRDGVRVVPNGRPWQRVEGTRRELAPEPLPRWEAPGAHEVLVEGADHRPAWRRDGLMAGSLSLARERMVDLRQDGRLRDVLWFRQHGRLAGARLPHPHSVLLAVGARPAWTERGCASCELVAEELGRRERLVAETDHAVALAPFAPTTDGELWVLPKAHVGSLEAGGDELARELGDLLARVMGQVDDALAGPASTIALRAAHGVHEAHLRLEIRPLLRLPDGLDALGRPRVHLAPEALARSLRRARHLGVTHA